MLRPLLSPKPSSSTSEPWTLRGSNPGRLENFSDATFSFTLALLIFSTEVPKDLDALLAIMPGFIPFAICFVILCVFWRRHVVYFQRYGLSDTTTVALNTILLAVILFYIYPLKFLMSRVSEVLLYALSGRHTPRPASMGNPATLPTVMSIYLIGFAAVSLAFALLFHHALRRRDELRLSPFELAATRDDLILWLASSLAALGAAAGARWLPPEAGSLSMFLLFVIPVVRRLQRIRRKRLIRAI